MIRFCLGFFLVILSSGVNDDQPLWMIPAIAIPGLILMFWSIPALNRMRTNMPLCVPYSRASKMGTSFIGTFYYDDPSDMHQLDNVRKMVSNMNKDLKSANKDYQFYVKCQGRGPRVLPSLRDGRGGRGYDSFLPLRHATHMDVYIYRR